MVVNAPEQSKPAFPTVRKDWSQKLVVMRERRSRLSLMKPLIQTSRLDRRSQTKLQRVLIGIAGADDLIVSKHFKFISGANAEEVFIAEEGR